MRDRIQEAFVDELEKMGYLGMAAKAVKATAGKALGGAATGMSRKAAAGVTAKQGLLKRVIKNPTVRGATSSLGQAAMWTLPSALMQQRQPREKPQPVTGGLV